MICSERSEYRSGLIRNAQDHSGIKLRAAESTILATILATILPKVIKVDYEHYLRLY